MKGLVVGDMHLDGKVGTKRVVDFFNIIKNSITDNLEIQKETDFVVLLGDYGMTPSMDNSYRQVLSEFIASFGDKPVIALLGQHDRNLAGHILQPIAPLCKNLTVVESVLEWEGMTFISHNRDTKQLEKDIKAAKPGLVFGHFNINGYETDSKVLDSAIHVDMPEHKFILGDIHKSQKQKNVIYVGSIAPVDLGQLQYDFGIGLVDSKAKEFKKIPIEYTFNVVKLNSEDDFAKINAMSRIIIKVKDKKEKAVWRAKLQDKEYLSLEFVEEGVEIKKEKLEVNVNFTTMVSKYLKMIGKEHLEQKIKEYMERV